MSTKAARNRNSLHRRNIGALSWTMTSQRSKVISYLPHSWKHARSKVKYRSISVAIPYKISCFLMFHGSCRELPVAIRPIQPTANRDPSNSTHNKHRRSDQSTSVSYSWCSPYRSTPYSVDCSPKGEIPPQQYPNMSLYYPKSNPGIGQRSKRGTCSVFLALLRHAAFVS